MKKAIAAVCGILIILTAVIMAFKTADIIKPVSSGEADTAEGSSYLESLENEKAADRENEIRTKREEYEKEQQQKKAEQESIKASEKQAEMSIPFAEMKEGSLELAFKDIIITGDSLVKSIWEYNVLDKSYIYAEIGAGIRYLKEISGEIIAQNPKYLVFHYGENELDGEEYAKYFISNYKQAVQDIQKALPDTEIYIDSIFPVTDKAVVNEPPLKYVDYYNKLIKQMAEELGVTYLDFDPLFASFEKNYYDADGIHPIRSFYPEQYLPFIYTEVKGQN